MEINKFLRFILLLIFLSIFFHTFLFGIPSLRWLEANDVFETFALSLVVLLTPLLILYICLKDYDRALSGGEKFKFFKSFIKQLIAITLYGFFAGFLINLSERGKEVNYSLGIILIFVLFGALIFSLIVTLIFYFLSKRKNSMN